MQPPSAPEEQLDAAEPSAELGLGTGWVGDLLSTQKILPVRYRIREDDDGRYLTCVEAPNVTARLDRSFCVTSAAARKYPEGTIFLDGAAQGEPFMDVERKIYNLDHHEGCVRSFTLSACEQAMVVILKGLDLRGGEWRLHANEPDLDTVLAIWLFLNHRRVTGQDPAVRRRLMPLVRLEGVIDAHGLELQELAGFPDSLHRATLETIDRLRSHELALKRDGQWQTSDPLECVLTVLHEMDQMVYTARDFEGMQAIEEIARVGLAADRVAIVCKTDLGIYEVEKHLRKLHGERVGVIVLDKGASTFTLRQVDPFLPRTLEPVYERLNQMDPNVCRGRRWGGSADIGGSPRGKGSGLDAIEVARVCQWVFQPPALRQRLATIVVAAVVALVVVGLGVLAAAEGIVVPSAAEGAVGRGVWAVVRFGTAVALASAALLWLLARRVGRQRIGVRRPSGWWWLALAPASFLAAMAGGAWMVTPSGAGAPQQWWMVGAAAVAAASCELLFRGAVQGGLIGTYRVMWSGGGWFPSVPAGVAAVLSALMTPLLYSVPPWLLPAAAEPVRLAAVLLSAVVLGLVCGMARERWASLWPPLLLHVAAAVAASVVVGLL